MNAKTLPSQFRRGETPATLKLAAFRAWGQTAGEALRRFRLIFGCEAAGVCDNPCDAVGFVAFGGAQDHD
jgi:hypothetical protein